METYFKVTAASIHQMGRKPRKARGLSPERPDKAARLSCDCQENNCRISNNVRANIYYADAHMLFLVAVPRAEGMVLPWQPLVDFRLVRLNRFS
jgi:hypothetical protein